MWQPSVRPACSQENIVTVARQQAKIARIEQEIQEAQAAQAQHLEPVFTSTEGQELTGQVPQTGLQQQHLQNDVKRNSKILIEANRQPAAVQTHLRSEPSLQPQFTPDAPHIDAQMTDAPKSAGDQAAEQSMWL